MHELVIHYNTADSDNFWYIILLVLISVGSSIYKALTKDKKQKRPQRTTRPRPQNTGQRTNSQTTHTPQQASSPKTSSPQKKPESLLEKMLNEALDAANPKEEVPSTIKEMAEEERMREPDLVYKSSGQQDEEEGKASDISDQHAFGDPQNEGTSDLHPEGITHHLDLPKKKKKHKMSNVNWKKAILYSEVLKRPDY